MDHRRILAAAAALCLIPAAGMQAYGKNEIFTAAAEESVVAADKVTLNSPGDISPIKLGGVTEKPTWYSDDEAVAKVVVTGDLSADIVAVGKGSTSVYAVFSNQILRFDVVVLRETPDEQIVVEIGTVTLTNEQSGAAADLNGVDNTEAVWASSDETVAVVDNKGNITAVGKGECVITAVYGNYTYVLNVISQLNEEVIVTPPTENLIGEITLTDDDPVKRITFEAPQDVEVIFSSTDESVAVVSADGVITAKGTGSCRIYAEVGGYRSYVNVTSTYTGKPASTTVGSITLTSAAPSQKMTLNNLPEGARVTWRSTDPKVASVDQKGLIVAVNSGKCKIIADVGGVEYSIDVTVDINDETELPTTTIKGIGKTITLQKTDGMVFTSSDTSVAEVDENGVVTAKAPGYAVIVATSGDTVNYLRVHVVKAGLIGDANCDGKVSIADSTAILQSMANQDKYGLSEEGMVNADVDATLGVSGMDALIIQMFDAKLINTLPYYGEV